MDAVTICSARGTPLAQCRLQVWVEPTTMVLDCLTGGGALLGYRFGRGLQDVVVTYEMFRLPGTLETKWLGNHREWRVRLRPVTAVEALTDPCIDGDTGATADAAASAGS